MHTGNNTMRQALRQVQAGHLQAATRTIQQALGASAGEAAKHDTTAARWGDAATRAPQGASADASCIEGEFRVVDDGRPSRAAPPPAAAPSAAGKTRDARLRFSCDAGDLEYRLHIPTGLDTTGAPLLLMLHGCTQTPEDFARGTRMNALAGAQGFVIAWPAQSGERNPNRCWNWFRRGDQQRDQGEPAMLAALTRELVARHRLDPRRVYVAGLSAGGAMAAVLADTHPDVYAAIGVHSGLPTGLARDMPSAFSAMRKGGARRARVPGAGTRPVPAIVFHGDGDTTVHPGNGQGVVEQSLGSGHGTGQDTHSSTEQRETAAGLRSATRTVHRDADGRIAAEHWLVHGAGHAWSGGAAAGTYTDPQGPDASLQMLRFFAQCRGGTQGRC